MTTMLDDLTVALKAELVRQERKAKQGPSCRAVPIDYTSLARAALQAIREQPPEIGYFQTIADAHRVSPQRAWADMIDAILEEKA